MKLLFPFVALFLVATQLTFAQNVNGIIEKYLNDVQAKSELKQADPPEWKISDVVPSLNPQIQHVYLKQYYKGIEIDDAGYKLTVKNNQVTWEIDQFVKDVKSKVTESRGALSPEGAILKVVKAHNLEAPKLVNSLRRSDDGVMEFAESGITIDNEAIKVKPIYHIDKENDKLTLAWNVSIYQKDGLHWWNENVDATSGKILSSNDWVISCDFGKPEEGHAGHKHDQKDSFSLFNNDAATTTSAAAVLAGSYNVYAMPVESPTHGRRSNVSNPDNRAASPFGWHDTNGRSGAEFTTTRGNNVNAQDDSNGNNGTGFQPNGGSGLNFNFPVNLNQAPSTFSSASITNLFYWNNIMHDVWYQYGFNEASGNFQENNYGKGGRGSDSVNADSQDGRGTNNANFSTPGDGSNPRMQMFLWTNPTRDGDFDNLIIAHEYGHGISTRLVGGPSANRLGGSEQMGEGWSDWFGLMLTMKQGDRGRDGRGVGTYARGQATNGGGIRPTRYSTNRSVNNTDYADINSLRAPHGVGYGFATILWDMTWALIDEEGFSSDFYNGNGGNNIAMALVIEGLKNTANNPGFVSGRDGILRADQDLYNGKYNCLIWTAFSERGVGLDANENNNGGTNTNTDQTVSFVNGCTDDPKNDGTEVRFVKRNAPGFAIDGGSGGRNGRSIELYNNINHPNLTWVEIDRGNGFYSYKKKNTNFCIDGGNGGANAQNVFLFECGTNNRNQHWRKINQGNGHVRLQKRNAPNFSIDGGRGGARDQNVYLWKSSNSNQNQHWRFVTVNSLENSEEQNTEEQNTEYSADSSIQVDNEINAIKMIPNPTNDQFAFHVNSGNTKNITVGIYTVLGQRKFESKLNSGVNNFSASNLSLSSGVYVVKIQSDGDDEVVKKLIVK